MLEFFSKKKRGKRREAMKYHFHAFLSKIMTLEISLYFFDMVDKQVSHELPLKT